MSLRPLSSAQLQKIATLAGGMALLVVVAVVLTEGGYGYPAQSLSAMVICSTESPCSEDTGNLTITARAVAPTLLLHADGVDGSSVFDDSSASDHAPTVNGNVRVDIAQNKFGGASAEFIGGGTNTNRISVAHHNDLYFGSDDFTVDFWFRPSNTNAGNRNLFYKSVGEHEFALNQSGTSLLLFASSNGTSFDIASSRVVASGLTANTWYHFAIARQGNSWRSFLNGTLTDTLTSSATIFNEEGELAIGGHSSASQDFLGHIDELRVSKGIARWTTNFTPPVAPYSEETDFLNPQEGVLLSWSAQNLPFTVPDVFCFGGAEGSACGSTFQTFGTSLSYAEGGWEVFTIGEDIFAAVANYDNANPSKIYKWSTTNSCFGNASGTCGSALQTWPSGGGNWARGGFTHFTVDGEDYLAQAEDGYPSKIYQWMDTVPGRQTAGLTAGWSNNFTYVERGWQLDPGATIVSIGAYYTTAQTVWMKVFKRNSAGNYDILVSQSCSHPGTGWHDCTLSTPFSVPSAGQYYVGTYGSAGAWYSSMSTSLASARSGHICATAPCTNQGSFSESYSGYSPVMRAAYQSPVEADCFGDGLMSCMQPAQIFTTGASSAFGGWEHFDIDGEDYLALSGDGDTSKIYKWMGSVTVQSSTARRNSPAPNYTLFDRSWQLKNGATVTRIGFYALSAGGTVPVKIGQFNGGSSYTVVRSQDCTASVVGWNDCILSTPYAVPASGIFHAGVYSSNIVDATLENVLRAHVGGNVAQGATQNFTQSSDNSPIVRVTYASPVEVNCFGDGSNCGSAFQNFASGASNNEGGWTYFQIGSDHYLAAASYYHAPSTIYKWSSANNCFGNISGTCGSALQTFPTSAAYYNYGGWTHFQYGSDHYLLSGNYYYDRPELLKWMSGSNCFGNGTTCGTPLYDFPSPYDYSYGGSEHFTVGSDHYIAFADENGANPSKIFKFMPASNCFGNGTTCGTPTQTFSSPLTYARGGFEHFQIGTGQYLAAGNYGQPASVFQLNAVTCFGNEDACGAVHQTATNQSVVDWEEFNLGAQKYVAAAGSNTIRLYKVMPDCIGNGTTCANSSGGNALQSITLSGVRDLSFGTGPQGTFLAAVASQVNIFKWQEAQQCFGNGTTCGTVYHTIPQNHLYEGEFFVENSILYYINFYNVEPQQGYLMLYKWMASGTSCPAGGGFGNGTTCGSVQQQINVGGTDRGNALTVFVVDGKRYVWGVNSDEGGSGAIIYQWQPAQACFGNGTTCSSKFSASPPGSEHGTEVTTYVIDGALYGSYFLNGSIYTAKWNSASSCWGNAAGTCGQTYVTQSGASASSYSEARVVNIGEDDFLIVAGNPALVFKWTDTGTNCPSGGYWGNGASCDTNSTNVSQTLSNASGAHFFSSDTDHYLSLNNNLFKYTGEVASACTLYQHNATNGTTTVASESVGTFTASALSETTTYTLSCNMDGGAVEQAALCIPVGNALTVTATDNSAAEAGGNTGTFTITRPVVTSSALVVNYTLSGTAANGNDYTSLSGSATIPADQASVTVVVTPTDDSYFEGNETVTLTLAESSGGSCGGGGSSAATITISDDETMASIPGDGNGLTSCVGTAGPTCMLGIMPERVRNGASTTVTWYVDGIAVGENGNPSGRCSISRNADDAVFPISSGGVVLWQDTTGIQSPITAQTIFTLTCTAPGGTASTTSRTVNLIPSVQEI